MTQGQQGMGQPGQTEHHQPTGTGIASDDMVFSSKAGGSSEDTARLLENRPA